MDGYVTRTMVLFQTMDKKKVLRFNAAMDIKLLNEVMNERPHTHGGEWETVSKKLQEDGIDANARRCREQNE